VLDLLPLLTGTLPADVVAAVVDDLGDPATFAAPHPVPTVALADPAFDPERMWRGPVWLNTNWLLVEGLRRSGCPDAARRLAERTLAMVVAAGGAFEYFNPVTAGRPPRAVPAFGWTAALFIDLAVRYAPPDLDPGERA
jgi:glycogen debranching enzyme